MLAPTYLSYCKYVLQEVIARKKYVLFLSLPRWKKMFVVVLKIIYIRRVTKEDDEE